VVRSDSKKVIELDPETAPLVLKLFEWYATGKFSLEEVAAMAKDAGLLMPRSKRPLNKQKLHRIFGGRLYYGEFVWKGKLYEPLVSRELWDQVQAKLDGRGKKKTRTVKHKLAFSGLIQCGHCGCALVGEIQKGKYTYYHCSGFKGKCEEPYVREETLEQKFIAVVKTLEFDAETRESISQSLRDSHRDEQRFHAESIARLQSDYARLQARIEQMYVDKLDGEIETSFFDQKSAAWWDEQRQLLRMIEQHQSANESYLEEGVAILELATRAAALFEIQDAREKRRLFGFRAPRSEHLLGLVSSPPS
jgi:site-specific DNA recombinase